MNKTYLLIAFIALPFAGCAIFGGDMPIRVSGAVPEINAENVRENCELSLVYAESGRTGSSHEVPAEFFTSFVIDAKSTPYYFVAKCRDGRVFRSREVVLGGRGSFDKLVELGTLSEEP
jgi:hypothetical protein